MMLFLLPGYAKNCQLPSSNNQNKTPRYSPLLKIIDNPALRSPVVLAGRPSCNERRCRAGDYPNAVSGQCPSRLATIRPFTVESNHAGSSAVNRLSGAAEDAVSAGALTQAGAAPQVSSSGRVGITVAYRMQASLQVRRQLVDATK